MLPHSTFQTIGALAPVAGLYAAGFCVTAFRLLSCKGKVWLDPKERFKSLDTERERLQALSAHLFLSWIQHVPVTLALRENWWWLSISGLRLAAPHMRS